MIRALRRWAKRYHERGKYTPVGVAFHWIMAAVVIYQLATGWMDLDGLLADLDAHRDRQANGHGDVYARLV